MRAWTLRRFQVRSRALRLGLEMAQVRARLGLALNLSQVQRLGRLGLFLDSIVFIKNRESKQRGHKGRNIGIPEEWCFRPNLWPLNLTFEPTALIQPCFQVRSGRAKVRSGGSKWA